MLALCQMSLGAASLQLIFLTSLWGGAESIEQYKLEKGIEVAERWLLHEEMLPLPMRKKLLAHWFSLSKTQSHNIES